VDVIFTPMPSVDDEREASLDIYASEGGTASATLRGTGIPTESGLRLTNAAGNLISFVDMSLDDGGTRVGQRSILLNVVVRNFDDLLSTGMLTVTREGANPDDFVIVSNGCAPGLGPNDTCQVDVAFAPTAVGERYASIVVTAAFGGTFSLTLRGAGLPP
jgi:hypothetical protein